MSILKQNFFAYYMAVGSIFSCATWQSSCNILEASSRLWVAISETGRQGYFISPIVLVRLPRILQPHLLGFSELGRRLPACSRLGVCSGSTGGAGPAPKNGCGAHPEPAPVRNKCSRANRDRIQWMMRRSMGQQLETHWLISGISSCPVSILELCPVPPHQDWGWIPVEGLAQPSHAGLELLHSSAPSPAPQHPSLTLSTHP